MTKLNVVTPESMSQESREAMDRIREAEAVLAQKEESALIADFARQKAAEDYQNEVIVVRKLQADLRGRLETARKLHRVVAEMDKLAQTARAEKREAELLVEKLRVDESTLSIEDVATSSSTPSTHDSKRIKLTPRPVSTAEEEERDGDIGVEEEDAYPPVVDSLIQEKKINSQDGALHIRITDAASLSKLVDRLNVRLPPGKNSGRFYKSVVRDADQVRAMIAGGQMVLDDTFQFSRPTRNRVCTFCFSAIHPGTEMVSPSTCTHVYHPACLAFSKAIMKPNQEYVCMAKANIFVSGVGKGCKTPKGNQGK